MIKISGVNSYFKQYCDSTSIHGFKYFGEKRSIFEKIWWIIIFIICLCGCSVMIYKIYEKYESSPVIVTFATKETPIYKIPFPAVTICPETKTVKNKFDFTKTMEKRRENLTLTDDEKRTIDYVSLFCDDHQLTSELTNKSFDVDFIDTLDQIKPDFFDSFTSCFFMGSEKKCDDILVPVITDEGICYSFNILDRRQIFNDVVKHYKDYHKTGENTIDWTMENGYFDQFAMDTNPKRALLAGVPNGLRIKMMTLKQDIDSGCKGMQGYKVVLHSPSRMPRLKQEYFRVALDTDVIVAVQPMMIVTSDTVKNFHIDKRDCHFSSERKLKYFRAYTQKNCELECLTNFTLKKCECVNIFMPRDNNTEICRNRQKCMKSAEIFYQSGGIANKFKGNLAKNLDEIDCNCMPLCTDLSYNSEISQTRWDWEQNRQFLKSKNIDENSVHYSSLIVYFKFNHFIASERHELYGPTDFVANFGGLLGLFTGFSILSLMEIIYFLTLRICCNIKMYGKWSGPNLVKK